MKGLPKRIFLEIQRRLPELLNRKITHYVSSLNTVNEVYVDGSHDDYSEGKPESLVHDYYEDYDYKQYIPVTTTQTTTTTTKSTTTTTATTTTTTPKPTSSTVRTILTFNTASLPRLRRPQPTPFHQIPRNLETGHYTYQHQYNSQVFNKLYDFRFYVHTTNFMLEIILPYLIVADYGAWGYSVQFANNYRK